jgi:beta-glucosidase
MTNDEKFTVIFGYFGSDMKPKYTRHADSLEARPAMSPAFRAWASRRSGRPTPASASPPRAAPARKRERTALPSGLATTATWNPELAFKGGAMIGAGGPRLGLQRPCWPAASNLMREPRNGRNFEYGGEDPLLAGTMVGAQIKGIQSNNIISTIKHYALNGQETGRFTGQFHHRPPPPAPPTCWPSSSPSRSRTRTR